MNRNKAPTARETAPAKRGPTTEEMALAITSGGIGAAAVLEEFGGGEQVHMWDILKPLNEIVARVKSGDLADMEEILVSQALALQGVFVHFASNAAPRKHSLQYAQHMLTMGLRAQAQCRATVQTLIDLKFPRQAVFAKQANITSGPQQVNNGISQPVPAHAERAEKVPNKLLEDTSYATKRMDLGAAQGAKQSHKDLASVGEIDGAEDRGGQSAGRKQRAQRADPPAATRPDKAAH
jgi:hypothetical protein